MRCAVIDSRIVMKVQLQTKVTVDTEAVFSRLRDVYNDSQLARIAVKMGEKTSKDNVEYCEALLHEAGKVLAKHYRDYPELQEERPDYAKAVALLADNDPFRM